MEATTPNIVGVAKSLTIFKLCATTPNNTQQLVTTCNRVCMQTDALYNIQRYLLCDFLGWPTMLRLRKILRPFARGFTIKNLPYSFHLSLQKTKLTCPGQHQEFSLK